MKIQWGLYKALYCPVAALWLLHVIALWCCPMVASRLNICASRAINRQSISNQWELYNKYSCLLHVICISHVHGTNKKVKHVKNVLEITNVFAMPRLLRMQPCIQKTDKCTTTINQNCHLPKRQIIC